MAFALTHLRAYGVKADSATRTRAIQHVILRITGTTADVDLDIGDDDGTFWTDALADTTYGDIAAQAQSALQDIVAQSLSLTRWGSQEFMDRLQAAAAASTSYTVAIEEKRPNITMAASNGETSYVIRLEYELNDNVSPYTADLGSYA